MNTGMDNFRDVKQLHNFNVYLIILLFIKNFGLLCEMFSPILRKLDVLVVLVMNPAKKPNKIYYCTRDALQGTQF